MVEHDKLTKSLKLYKISDSDVFRSVEVPSRPKQNQNVNVNAQKTVSPTDLRLTAITTKSAFCALHGLHGIKLTRRRRYSSAEIFIVRFV